MHRLFTDKACQGQKSKYKTEIGVKHAHVNFCSHHIQSKIYSCLQFLTIIIVSLKFANGVASYDSECF